MCDLNEYLKKFGETNVVAVTNRHLCTGDFFEQIEKLAKSNVKAIILREKDLSEKEYESLAKKAAAICEKYNKELILHTFYDAALKLNHKKIHLPIFALKEACEKGLLANFEKIGTSVHSLKQLEEAKNCGATYCTAGHIFATNCKKDLPPRGLDFLAEICANAVFPVYAIGGISDKNAFSATEAGAAGVCLMSSVMDK